MTARHFIVRKGLAVNTVDPQTSVYFDTRDAALLPSGNNAQRPSNAAVGMVRYNTEIGDHERYDGSSWLKTGDFSNDVVANSSGFFTGNSTANVVVNSSSFRIGSDVVANALGFFVGNLSANSTHLKVGNFSANSIHVQVGNSTVNTVVNSSTIVSNGTNILSVLAGKSDTGHSHSISDVDDLQANLDSKAPINSPTLTGVPRSVTRGQGSNSDHIATTEFVHTALDGISAGLGEDQSWTNVTGGRDFSTNYTNNTGRPIFVIIDINTATSISRNISFLIDGSTILTNTMNGGSDTFICAIIPAGSTYRITNDGSQVEIGRWWELR